MAHACGEVVGLLPCHSISSNRHVRKQRPCPLEQSLRCITPVRRSVSRTTPYLPNASVLAPVTCRHLASACLLVAAQRNSLRHKSLQILDFALSSLPRFFAFLPSGLGLRRSSLVLLPSFLSFPLPPRFLRCSRLSRPPSGPRRCQRSWPQLRCRHGPAAAQPQRALASAPVRTL